MYGTDTNSKSNRSDAETNARLWTQGKCDHFVSPSSQTSIPSFCLTTNKRETKCRDPVCVTFSLVPFLLLYQEKTVQMSQSHHKTHRDRWNWKRNQAVGKKTCVHTTQPAFTTLIHPVSSHIGFMCVQSSDYFVWGLFPIFCYLRSFIFNIFTYICLYSCLSICVGKK